jgi:DNA polymerase-4
MFRIIFHLDMDAFYASVEQRDDPNLRGKPVIVGSPPTQRGVVCAASYEARKFGVRSALPSSTAARLCPKGVFVRPRMDAYLEESHRIMEIIASTGAIVEQMSVDEAYLDMSGICQAETMQASLQKALPLAQQLKQQIRSERQLTATIGIASNKLLAKTGLMYCRFPNMPPLVPMTSASVLVALAMTGEVPKASRVGKVRSVPPPATALIIPAPTAEPARPVISQPEIICSKV